MADAISTLEPPVVAEPTRISDLDFLSPDEQEMFRTVLLRVTLRMPSVMLDLGRRGRPEDRQLVSIWSPPAVFRSIEPGSPEWEEMDRMEARKDEFVEFGPFPVTMRSR